MSRSQARHLSTSSEPPATEAQSRTREASPSPHVPLSPQQVLRLQRTGGNRAAASAIALQRTPVKTVVTDTAELRDAKLVSGQHKSLWVNEKKKVGAKLHKGDKITIDPDYKSSDGKWVYARFFDGLMVGAIRTSKALATAASSLKGFKPEDPKKDSPYKDLVDAAGFATGVYSEASGQTWAADDDLLIRSKFYEKYEDLTKKYESEGMSNADARSQASTDAGADISDTRTTLTGVMGGFDTGSGLLATVGAVKAWIDVYKKGGVKNWWEALWSTKSVLGGISLGISELAAAGGDAGAVAAGGWNASVGECLDVFKKFVETVKTAYQDFKSWGERSAKTNAKAVGRFVSGALDTARDAVKNVKHFMDMVGEVPAGGMLTAIPVLGIVLRAVKMGFTVLGMVFAGKQRSDMEAEKREAKGGSRGPHTLERQDAVGRPGDGGGASSSRKGWYAAAKLSGKGKEATLLGWREEAYAMSQDQALTQPQRDAAKKRYEEIDRYLTSRDLEYINDKRLRRGGLNLAEDFVHLAGDVTAVVPMANAATVPLKAIGAGIGLGGKAVRGIKQFIIDYREGQGKEPSRLGQSTKTKEAKYYRNAGYIFERIANIDVVAVAKMDWGARKAELSSIDKLVTATGMDLKEFWRTEDPAEKFMALISAQKERD